MVGVQNFSARRGDQREYVSGSDISARGGRAGPRGRSGQRMGSQRFRWFSQRRIFHDSPEVRYDDSEQRRVSGRSQIQNRREWNLWLQGQLHRRLLGETLKRIIRSPFRSWLCNRHRHYLSSFYFPSLQGDDGSSLVYGGAVVGIASWYYPCGLGLPDVYTRVYRYMPWILDIISRTFFEEFFDFEDFEDLDDEWRSLAIVSESPSCLSPCIPNVNEDPSE